MPTRYERWPLYDAAREHARDGRRVFWLFAGWFGALGLLLWGLFHMLGDFLHWLAH